MINSSFLPPATPSQLYVPGMNVPFLQSKPKFGFNSAVALIQITLGGAMLCGNTSIFPISKFLHDVFVLHSIMMASVCLRFGSPASYQQGYN
jgi:hypothetical protein